MLYHVGIVTLVYMYILHANGDFSYEQRLHHNILQERDYLKMLRPPGNGPNETLTLKLGLRLSQILAVSEKYQIITTNVWLRHEWYDLRLRWDPLMFGNITYTHFPSEDLWMPDIILYNNADGDFNVTLSVKATLYYTGLVVWEPPVIYKSYCPINVEFFPFDQQECFMKFSSWTYDGVNIDLRHVWEKDLYSASSLKSNETFIPMGIDLCDYTENVEWDVINVTAVKRNKYYPCCEEPYPFLCFNVTIRRKTLFYTINLILPIIAISTVTVLVFYLPSNSGEKITLSISILLALTVFFLLMSDISPPTSIAIPLIGKYLLFTMIMVTMSIFLTVYTLSIHFRTPATHKMSPWVRRIFTDLLPKCLMMTRPKKSSRVVADLVASSKDNDQNNIVANNIAGTPKLRQRRNALASKFREETKKSIQSVIFIAKNLRVKDQQRQEEKDWNYMAMVMDRLFLYIFMLACVFGTIGIFLNAPSIRDPRVPLSRLDFNCSKK